MGHEVVVLMGPVGGGWYRCHIRYEKRCEEARAGRARSALGLQNGSTQQVVIRCDKKLNFF